MQRVNLGHKADALGLLCVLAGLSACSGTDDGVSNNAGSGGQANAGSSSSGNGGMSNGGDAGTTVTCEPGSYVGPRIYRLSVDQFSNAVRDLLELPQAPEVVGGDSEAAVSFYPRDDAPVQPGLASSLSNTVRTALSTVNIGTLSNCATDATPACAQTFLADFAARAFRRPLTDEDKQALYLSPTSPFAVGAKVDVNSGIRLALEAILNAPSFIYRRELADTPDQRLDSYETAAQLSFLFRDSVPDAELWQAATNGQLQTDQEIEVQVDRLLDLPEVQANVTRIIGSWFGLEKVLTVSKDADTFPGYNEGNLQAAMMESTRLFVHELLWSGSGAMDGLLTSPRIYLNGPLAQMYGVTFTGPTPQQFVAFDRPEERAGMMTQPALMAGFSSSKDSSVVKRGLFVVRKALCLSDPPSPTGDILSQAAAQAEDETTTEREKAEYRATHVCIGCHAMIDPYGLVFENYDAIGRFRSSYASGKSIDASTLMSEDLVLAPAERAADEDGSEPIANALQFAQGLTKTAQFAACGNKQILSYALGREVERACVDRYTGSIAIRNDMTIRDVFRRVILNDLTRKRGGQ